MTTQPMSLTEINAAGLNPIEARYLTAIRDILAELSPIGQYQVITALYLDSCAVENRYGPPPHPSINGGQALKRWEERVKEGKQT